MRLQNVVWSSPRQPGACIGQAGPTQARSMIPGATFVVVAMVAVVTGQLLPQSLAQPAGVTVTRPAATPTTAAASPKSQRRRARVLIGASVYALVARPLIAVITA